MDVITVALIVVVVLMLAVAAPAAGRRDTHHPDLGRYRQPYLSRQDVKDLGPRAVIAVILVAIFALLGLLAVLVS
ncbi:MAG: hypothetical protein M3Q10_09380 [Chloroflexota bacterium]|nr:hypothetical protein [Chloroflexota bacterium]